MGAHYSGFDGPAELVTAPIYGARTFNVSPVNWLTGVSHALVYQPGVTHSVCDLEGSQHGPDNEFMPTMVECSCGFHAWFADNVNDYHGAVAGIIEATGETVVGTRGFRASRAEIKALYPTHDRFDTRRSVSNSAWMRFGRGIYPTYDWYVANARGLKLDALAILIGSISLGLGMHANALGVVVGALVFVATVLWGIGHSNRKVTAQYVSKSSSYPTYSGYSAFNLPHAESKLYNLTRKGKRFDGNGYCFRPSLYSEALRKIQANYPGVEVFDSEEEAFAAFPLTDPREYFGDEVYEEAIKRQNERRADGGTFGSATTLAQLRVWINSRSVGGVSLGGYAFGGYVQPGQITAGKITTNSAPSVVDVTVTPLDKFGRPNTSAANSVSTFVNGVNIASGSTRPTNNETDEEE